MSRFADGCTRVYTPSGRVAHLKPPYGHQAGDGALCHVFPAWPSAYLGTGSQREYELAASLPLCKLCARFAGGEDEYRSEACQWTAAVCTLAGCLTHHPTAPGGATDSAPLASPGHPVAEISASPRTPVPP